MATIFLHNNAPHRIIRQQVVDKNAGFNEAHYNVLQRQERGLFGITQAWVTIEMERIPDYVIVALGCFGDTDGWRSSLPAAGFAR